MSPPNYVRCWKMLLYSPEMLKFSQKTYSFVKKIIVIIYIIYDRISYKILYLLGKWNCGTLISSLSYIKYFKNTFKDIKSAE